MGHVEIEVEASSAIAEDGDSGFLQRKSSGATGMRSAESQPRFSEMPMHKFMYFND